MKPFCTGNYFECEAGNLISISKDKGKDAGFSGKSMLELAPKESFFRVWRNNTGKIPEKENTQYYINEYYKQVLSQVDIPELLKEEKNPILLCYEKDQQFCHRHVVAEYCELMYDIKVPDIKIDKNLNIEVNKRPTYIKPMLERAILETILMPESGTLDVEYLEKNKDLLFKIIPELKEEDGFDQKSPWHIYDVWKHTEVALSNSEPDLESRLVLLLHDIGKPKSYQEEDGIRHFKGHPQKSAEISFNILKRLGYSDEQITRMCYFIENHATQINPANIKTQKDLEMAQKLLNIQFCDTKAYNPEKTELAMKKLNTIKSELESKEDIREL